MGADKFPPPPPGFGTGVPHQSSAPPPAHASNVSSGSAGFAPAHPMASAGTYAGSAQSSPELQVSPEHGFYSPVAAVKSCLRRYVGFRGRACASEFWWFALAVHVVLVFAVALDSACGYDDSYMWSSQMNFSPPASGPFLTVFMFLAMPPLMAVFSRRMHDTGRSGWSCFWLVTGLGIFWIIYWLSQQGGANVDNGRGLRP